MEGQRERARQASKMGAVAGDPVYMGLLEKGKTRFLGYESPGRRGRPGARGAEGRRAGDRASTRRGGRRSSSTARRSTAESGGQVGDQGVIAARGSAAEVADTTQPLPGLHVHHVKVTAGGFEPGMTVRAQIDAERRAGAMRHHTGTHLLHAALRETLGTHVKQAGSLVAPDRLRFDFSHYQPVGPRELRHIENRVNAQILRDTPVQHAGHGPGGGAGLRRAGLLRRQVRREGARGRDPRLLQGVLRRHPRPADGRDRPVPGHGRAGHLRRHAPGRGAHRRGRGASARRQDQRILEELEETAKVDRRSPGGRIREACATSSRRCSARTSA